VIQDVSHSFPLRVALASGSVPLGGSTIFLINFAGELVRRGIPVEVMSFERENPLASDFQGLHIPLLWLDDRHEIFEDRMQKILERLREFKPTVVLANLSAISFEALRYTPPGVFRAGVIHSDDARVYEMAGHYAGCLDLIAVVSKTIRDQLQKRGDFARVPIQYLPLGVPIQPEGNMARIDPLRPLRIFYLGRLDRDAKRVHLFPQILEQLKASGIPFHWTIVGDGPEKAALERAMQSSPAQMISFPGKISYADVPELLQAHDIFLLVSDYEGLPLSLLEAMGAGLVPVVSDLASGIPEVVDAANGILVPVNDVDGYARAIVHLHQHRDELAAKSAAARARVRTEFSVAAMADRWLAAFPQNAPAIGAWPTAWDIKPPLVARHPVYFSPPMRVIRRLVAKFLR
jgi:glycosyltransferase involved in cell wall biosynthesis